MTKMPFERKSKVNTNSDNYLDANGNYVYTRMVRQPNGKWEREVIDVVPLTAENMECMSDAFLSILVCNEPIFSFKSNNSCCFLR